MAFGKIGSEFQVNTTTERGQIDPAVAALDDGGAIIVWSSASSNSTSNILAQRYDANGIAVGGEILINSDTSTIQDLPSVAALSGGGYVVTWTTSTSDIDTPDIMARMFDGTDTPTGPDFVVNSHLAEAQTNSSVASFPDGSFVVVWNSYGQVLGGDSDIFAQRFLPDGSPDGDEFRVNAFTPNYQYYPEVITYPDGSFATIWQDEGQDGGGLGVYMSRHANDNSSIFTDIQVNQRTIGTQQDPQAVALADGSTMVVYAGHSHLGDSEIMARKIAPDGTAGPELVVNTTSAGNQFRPSVTTTPDGGFIVAWNHPDPIEHDIRAQKFDALGNPDGAEFVINSTTADFQTNPDLVMLNSGVVVAAWMSHNQDGDGYGVFAQALGALQPNTPPTGDVAIIGTAEQKQVLSADYSLVQDGNGITPGSGYVVWMRDGSPILDNMGNPVLGDSYTLSQADVGHAVTAVYHYTDGQGYPESVQSAATAPVTNINDDPTGSAKIDGIFRQNERLTINLDDMVDLDGINPNTVRVEWLADGSTIANGATSTVLGQNAVGKSIVARVSYTDNFGARHTVDTAASTAVENVNDFPTGELIIHGDARQGEQLRADIGNIGDLDQIDYETIAIQWLRNGVPVEGATSPNYMLTQADVGAQIAFQYSYIDQQGTSEFLTSANTDPVENVNDLPTSGVSIIGTPRQHEMLIADLDPVVDPDGVDEQPMRFQWFRDGEAIESATEQTYVLIQEDVGTQLTVEFYYTDRFGADETLTSDASDVIEDVNDPATGPLPIQGDAIEYSLLTADISQIEDNDGMDPSHVSYTWMRNGEPIEGAVGASYRLTKDDIGSTISVKMYYIDAWGWKEDVTSAPTEMVANFNDEPIGVPAISGELREGETLTVDLRPVSDADGISSPPLSVQWYRDGEPIEGATEMQYTLEMADVTSEISVEVRYQDGPVTFLCRPKCSFRPLSVRKRPDFSNPVLNGDVVDCRSR